MAAPELARVRARKIVCVGAKKEEDIYEAIENLRRKLEDSEVLIRS